MKSFITNLLKSANSHKVTAKKPNLAFKSQIKAGGADGTVYNNANNNGSGTGTVVVNGADGTVY